MLVKTIEEVTLMSVKDASFKSKESGREVTYVSFVILGEDDTIVSGTVSKDFDTSESFVRQKGIATLDIQDGSGKNKKYRLLSFDV